MLQGGSLWTGLLVGAITQLKDHKNMKGGLLDKKQYTSNTTKNVTGSVGIMAGVEYGALLGSTLFPGVGTAVGALAGAVVGGQVGHSLGHGLGQMAVKQKWFTKKEQVPANLGTTTM